MEVIEVTIGPAGDTDMFKVSARSPAGEATAIVDLAVEVLRGRRNELQHAVLTSTISGRGILSAVERPLREVGSQLFSAILGTGELVGCYRASAALAADRGQRLRVTLYLDTPLLAGLPWEAMYDAALGAYVCRRVELVRQIPVISPPTPLRVQLPLRILGVVSSPHGLPVLDAEREKENLRRALGQLHNDGLVEIHWTPKATWNDIHDLLISQEWHVLHFIGHGYFDSDRDEGVLVLMYEDGRQHQVEAGALVDLLRRAHPMPRLVVLNSCSGARGGVHDLFSGTAASLVRGGVSAVAAMQYEITDAAATVFARGFYSAIARGRGVDDATSSGRVAIIGAGDRTLEWVTPVLYLRGSDGQLFTLSGSTMRTTTTQAPSQVEQISFPVSDGHSATINNSRSRSLPRLSANHDLPSLADRWRYTADAFEVLGLMRIAESISSKPAYIRPSQENLRPRVRIGILVASSRTGPILSISELREKFFAFLNREPINRLMSTLTSVTAGFSWIQSDDGGDSLEAVGNGDRNEHSPAISATLHLPFIGHTSDRQGGSSAELFLDIEPRTDTGDIAPPANYSTWHERFTEILRAPSAFIRFLRDEIGLIVHDEPPLQLGILLQAQHSLTELVDPRTLKRMPDRTPPSWFTVYAVADPVGKSAAAVTLDIMKELCGPNTAFV